MRIASLLPAATELLCAIPGGRELLVARTHECDFPASVADVPIVTASTLPRVTAATDIDAAVRRASATKAPLDTIDVALLERLKPDIILTQNLCHVCSIDADAVRSAVSRFAAPPQILTFSPDTIEAVLDDLLTLGRAIRLEPQATNTLVALRERLYRAQDYVNPFADGPRVAVLEWTDPLYIAGHWTPQLVERAGALHPLNPTQPVPGSGAAMGPQHAFRKAGKSIPIPHEALVAIQPEALIIAPCGVPLDHTKPSHYTGHTVEQMTQALAEHAWFRNLPAYTNNRIALVDGNQIFSRPGPRLVDAFEWLVAWLNNRPDLTPPHFPWRPFNP